MHREKYPKYGKMFCPKTCTAIVSIWAEMLKPHTFPIMESLNKLYWSHTVGFYAVMISDIYEGSVNLIVI